MRFDGWFCGVNDTSLKIYPMDNRAAIGIFDSGFGGLTVARAIWEQLPHDDIIYLGDTARQPYGSKSLFEVREYALECLDSLYRRGVKVLVIACNSASSAVLRDARERFDIPVIEVIVPAAKAAVNITRNGKIGVICTAATAMSRSYDDALAAVPNVQLFTSACPLFVDFVEQGITGGKELMVAARQYLAPLQEAKIDTLILGCTHYPLLAGPLSYILGDGVSLVSSAAECAKATYATLARLNLIAPQNQVANRTFYTTGNPAEFSGIGRRLMGDFITETKQLW